MLCGGVPIRTPAAEKGASDQIQDGMRGWIGIPFRKS
jgi:hypothetical protein